MWDIQQYEKIAKNIACEFVSSNGDCSINQVATKVAQDSGLNPHQVRTMVRLANVAAFQQIFEKKADGDKMVKFEPGDAEVVIENLHKEAEERLNKVTEKVAEYNRAQDFYGDIPVGTVKEASVPEEEEVVTITVNPYELSFNIKEASDKLQIEKHEAEFVWKDRLEKAARLLNMRELPNFEKDAIASLGESIVPELRIVQGMVDGDTASGLSTEKVASILGTHVAVVDDKTKEILDLLKEARVSRYNFVECEQGQEKLAKHLDELSVIVSS